MSLHEHKKFQFDLISPDRVLMSEEVVQVDIPGVLGMFGVLFDHAPVLSSLNAGVVTVMVSATKSERIFISAGVADIKDNVCTILAETAMPVSDIVRQDVDANIKSLEMEFEKAEDIGRQLRIAQDLKVERAKHEALTFVD